jgi:hypothetical protein
VTADGRGNYTVQLGATKLDGLPLGLFSSGEARWLGVTVSRNPPMNSSDESKMVAKVIQTSVNDRRRFETEY